MKSGGASACVRIPAPLSSFFKKLIEESALRVSTRCAGERQANGAQRVLQERVPRTPAARRTQHEGSRMVDAGRLRPKGMQIPGSGKGELVAFDSESCVRCDPNGQLLSPLQGRMAQIRAPPCLLTA